MTTDVVTVRIDTPVTEIARLMAASGISGAPVLDDRDCLVGDDVDDIAEAMVKKGINRVPIMRDCRLVGIVSRADILKAIAAGK